MKIDQQVVASELRKREKNTTDSNSSETSLISKVWERFNHVWGRRFSATYGESALTTSAFADGLVLTEVAKTWAAGLSGFTPEHIGNGLRQCINQGDSWPPTLPEFVKMCKQKPPPKIYRAAIESDEMKDRRKKLHKTTMAEIKNILKD